LAAALPTDHKHQVKETLGEEMQSETGAVVEKRGHASDYWRWIVPVLLTVALAVSPHPEGLSHHAWWYFSLFAGVVAALVVEPLPPAAIGFIAIALTAALSRWTLFSIEDLARPGFNLASESVKWAFSGFASSTVWLVGGAFMLAMAYEKPALASVLPCTWSVRSGTTHCCSVMPLPFPTPFSHW
jgi:hypothetical protein